MKDMGNRQFSLAEQIPGDVWQMVFAQIDLKELSNIASVSSLWNRQSFLDPRWREHYMQEFNELYHVLGHKIPPNMFRKKYLEMLRASGEIKKSVYASKKGQEMSELQAAVNNPVVQTKKEKVAVKVDWAFKEKIDRIFKNAVKKNSLEVTHILLKKELLNIYSRVELRGSKGTSDRSSLIHYAAIKGSFDMVKLLLLHGADVTRTVTWRRGNQKKTPSSILDDIPAQNVSLKSLICIGYAEYFLLNDDLTLAVQFFEKSYQYDPRVISEYIAQVHHDRVGFKFNYNENSLSALHACFENLSTQLTCIVDLNRQPEKRCVIL